MEPLAMGVGPGTGCALVAPCTSGVDGIQAQPDRESANKLEMAYTRAAFLCMAIIFKNQ
ncbi:hypothetical protein ESCAB7627_2381 [Escherichia albertii TW07627]|uniref:Uncharacterized protein n=1 Tax=Escherichia albertii (strain TW07627) TaxID=502347 RepID=A0ABC9NNP8_ESCAT|nr:hypothetical protein ESCAB7627_2381 [Escherichia albertii TW07627]